MTRPRGELTTYRARGGHGSKKVVVDWECFLLWTGKPIYRIFSLFHRIILNNILKNLSFNLTFDLILCFDLWSVGHECPASWPWVTFGVLVLTVLPDDLDWPLFFTEQTWSWNCCSAAAIFVRRTVAPSSGHVSVSVNSYDL